MSVFENAEKQARYISEHPYAWDDYEDAIQAYIEEVNKYEKQKRNRRQRIADCGKWGYYFDPHTGAKSGYIISCGLFRECPRCAQKRAEQEAKWMMEAFHRMKGEMEFLVVDDKNEADKLLRGIPKGRYVRYPQENGQEYIFSAKKNDLDGDTVSPEFLRMIDWQATTNTPAGRNKSGTMHVPRTTKKPENFSIVKVKQFVPDAPTEIVDRAMSQAILDTLDFDPESAQEVKDAINKRVSIAVQILKDHGYHVRVYEKKIKVIISQIKWSKFAVINNLNTENSTSNYEPPG